MISFIKQMYNVYLLAKVKNLYANEKYDSALEIIDKINFKNKAYFYIMRGMIFFHSDNLNKAFEDLNMALKYLNEEKIFNNDEINYLKYYTYNNIAFIFKERVQKEDSIKMIKLRNEYNVFNIDNIREHLLEYFPIMGSDPIYGT